MSRSRRAVIEQIYRAAVHRADPAIAVTSAVVMETESIVVDGARYPVPEMGVFAIAIGKASAGMLSGAEQVLGGTLVAAIGVAKQEFPSTERVTMLVGAHPVPDERSLSAGRAVRIFAEAIPEGALVLCMISGGGSALVEDLKTGVTLGELRRVTSGLLHRGASIGELNAVRSRMSALKAGGLIKLLRHTTVVNLIVSDVLGDDLHAIASGPTVPPIDDESAEVVLTRYGMSANLPAREATDASEATAPQTLVVANISHAIDAAASVARELGYEPMILSRSIEGEASVVGAAFADSVLRAASERRASTRPVCWLAGGETTVTVRGDGVGGRNSEAALAAAIRLVGAERIAIGFLATDGDDGITGAAGAIVDGSTLVDASTDAARAALDGNDSYTFLDRVGATFAPGPTGTNVNDLMIAMIW